MLLVFHGLEILVFAVLLVHIRKEILVLIVCSSVRIVNLLLFVWNVMMDILSINRLIPVKKYLFQLYQNLHQHQHQQIQPSHLQHLLPHQPPPTQIPLQVQLQNADRTLSLWTVYVFVIAEVCSLILNVLSVLDLHIRMIQTSFVYLVRIPFLIVLLVRMLKSA